MVYNGITVCKCGSALCNIPAGLCHCDCGKQATNLFIFGHHKRKRLPIEKAVPFRIIDNIDNCYCRLIPLTRGIYAIVNESDYEWLMQWKWMAVWFKHANAYYAVREENNKAIEMHRLLLGAGAEGKNGDHRNGNSLDNRRNNLRPADDFESMRNRGRFKNNTSGYKGVCWHKGTGKWVVRITYNLKRISLGYFDAPEEAYKAYCEAAVRLHGEFARLK